MTTEKTLHEISVYNLNGCVARIAENRRLLRIAKITGNKNDILKLTFQKNNLEKELEYHTFQKNNLEKELEYHNVKVSD